MDLRPAGFVTHRGVHEARALAHALGERLREAVQALQAGALEGAFDVVGRAGPGRHPGDLIDPDALCLRGGLAQQAAYLVHDLDHPGVALLLGREPHVERSLVYAPLTSCTYSREDRLDVLELSQRRLDPVHDLFRSLDAGPERQLDLCRDLAAIRMRGELERNRAREKDRAHHARERQSENNRTVSQRPLERPPVAPLQCDVGALQ